MADSGFTLTGLDALRAGIDQLPAAVTGALRGVAETTAGRVRDNAEANLASRTHGQGNTAAALQVTADDANRQFIVGFGLIANRPANLPLWLEYGYMHYHVESGAVAHRPGIYFMHDAATAEDAQYQRDCEAAAVGEAQQVFA